MAKGERHRCNIRSDLIESPLSLDSTPVLFIFLIIVITS